MARVVVVEPYYGGSHRAWADNWCRHSRHDMTLLTLPDEFWRWRLRGGAVTLAEKYRQHVEAAGRPDAIVVSGMVDVAAFSGLARRALGDVPVAIYVHESQLLYPLAPNQRADNSAALTNWQSLVASDAVWFNSAFQRDALERALPALLEAQPEPRHTHLIDGVFARSTVLWPGVDVKSLIEAPRSARSVPRVLWTQRWDHDKNPRSVFAALAALADEGVAFTLALAGESQRPDSAEVAWVQDRLGDRIDQIGYLPEGEYRSLLTQCDVVVSAADHEFFGIAIVEALAAGSVPVLPTRLSFPELIPAQWQQASLYADGELRTRLRSTLTDLASAQVQVDGLRQSMSRFDVAVSAEAHDQAVEAVLR